MTSANEIVTVKIDALKLHPDNPRRGDVPAIMRSLERFGQVKPIVVQRSTGYVVAGNHTLEAARRLGWPTIRVMIEDMDDDTARAYLIADNRTSDKGSYDRESLYNLLGSMLGDLAGTGWDEEEVEEVLSREADGVGLVERTGTGDDAIDEVAASYDPLRQILLMVPMSEMESFTRQIAGLQEHWQTRTTVETIRRVVDIAFNALPKPEDGFVSPTVTTEF